MKFNKQIRIGIAIFLFICAIILIVMTMKRSVHDLPDILKNGRLSVLIQSNTTGMTIADGKVTGFQYEIVKAFADTMGLELVVTEETDLKESINDLNDGDYDIVAHLIPITTEWKDIIAFTTPLVSTHQVVVQRITNDSVHFNVIDKQIQLANESIYITKNSPYKMRLENLSDEIASPINIVELDDINSEELVKKVANGEIKYCICESNLANKLKHQYLNIDVSLPIGFEQKQAWGVHPQSKLLLEKLNEFLSDFIGSVAYWEIYSKYYSVPKSIQ